MAAGTPRQPVGRRDIDAVKVRKWLVARGFSVTTLAKRARLSRATVGQVLRGSHCTGPKALAGLAEALGVRGDDLLEDPPVAAELFTDPAPRAEPGPVHGKRRIRCPF